jgi:hypothetical protein
MTLAKPAKVMMEVNGTGMFTCYGCLWEPHSKIWRGMSANVQGGVVIRPLRREDFNGPVQEANKVSICVCMCVCIYVCMCACVYRHIRRCM